MTDVCPVCKETSYETDKIRGKNKAHCNKCDIWFPIEIPVKVLTTMYIHGSKESNYDEADELDLTGNAREKFIYSLSEVALDVEINTTTGEVMIMAVNGSELKKPVAG